METWIFWGCAALLVVSALSVVVQVRPVRAFVQTAVLAGSAAALCLVLSAPVIAGVLVLSAVALVGVASWISATPVGRPEGPPVAMIGPAAGARHVGVTLVAGLVLELAWVFRQVRAAPLDDADGVSAHPWMFSAGVLADHLVAATVVGVLLVAVSAGASALLRRDPG